MLSTIPCGGFLYLEFLAQCHPYFIFNDFYTCIYIHACTYNTSHTIYQVFAGLTQPPDTEKAKMRCRKGIAENCCMLNATSQCLIISTILGTVSSLHPTCTSDFYTCFISHKYGQDSLVHMYSTSTYACDRRPGVGRCEGKY